MACQRRRLLCTETAAAPRLQLLLLLLAAHGSVLSQELVSDGDFALPSAPASVFRGARATVSAAEGTMREFPGLKTSAMQLLSGRGSVSVTTATHAHAASGWFRLQFFAYAGAGYDPPSLRAGAGTADPLPAGSAPLVVDLLDAARATRREPAGLQAAPSYSFALRAPREEWLHYDEWIPVPFSGTTALRLTIFRSGGALQLTGLSVTFEAFASRGLDALNWASAGAVVACTEASDADTVECPNDFSQQQISTKAFDNDLTTQWMVASQIPAGSGLFPTVALELSLDETVEVCGVSIVFDQSADFPRAWRFMAQEGDGAAPAAWSLWADARTSWPEFLPTDGESAASARLVSGGSLQQFGRQCTRTRRVRLEMDDASSGIFFKLTEVQLLVPLSGTAACACRNGGICMPDGTCGCPADLGCSAVACGWAGPTCEQAGCVTAVTCANLGWCSGANTCTCERGYSGVSADGFLQCHETVCGDGHTATVSLGQPTGEQCDDGNTQPGDGCSATCRIESLPSGFRRVLSGRWEQRSIALDLLATPDPSEATLALALGLQAEQIQILRSADGYLYYSFSEYVVTCEMDCSGSQGRCTMANRTEVCACEEGFTGSRCELSQCSRRCAHGGRCAGPDLCVECASGWEGTFCGTLTSTAGRSIAAACTVIVCLLLAVAIVLVCLRADSVPIRARGASSLCGSFVGGAAWVVSAFATLVGEPFGYAESEGLFGAWVPLVGFGVWLTANSVHLRAMVQIHIFHVVPLSFFPWLLVLGLLPWVLTAAFGWEYVGLVAAIVAFLWNTMLLSQLWPLRDDLTDCLQGTLASLAGIVVWLLWRWGKTEEPRWALALALAVDAVVLLHFCVSSLRVLRAMDSLVAMASYHDDYKPIAGTFRESMLSFDTQVRLQREQLPAAGSRDRSFTARVSRTRVAKGVRSSGRWLVGKKGRRVAAAPPEGGEGGEADAPVPVQDPLERQGSFRRLRQSTIGVQLSSRSFERGQFGARKVLSEKTRQRLGRYVPKPPTKEEKEAEAMGFFKLPKQGADSGTAAQRGQGWRDQASARVEQQQRYQRSPEKAGPSPPPQAQHKRKYRSPAERARVKPSPIPLTDGYRGFSPNGSDGEDGAP